MADAPVRAARCRLTMVPAPGSPTNDPVEPGVVDTHVHVRSSEVDRYPLRPTGIGSDWWNDGDHRTEALLGALDAGGVAAAILVQAVGPYGFDNSYVLDSAALAPERLSVVVAIDLDDPGAGAEFERLAEHPAVRGVRFFGMTERRHWIGTPTASAGFALAARLGLPVVVTVPGELLAELAPAILAADTAVVLDHCGFPVFGSGRIAEDQAVWRFAAADHVALKVTTHSFQLAAGDGAEGRLLTHLADRFGMSRLMWGSDFPQSSRTSYPSLVDVGRSAALPFGDLDRTAFLGGNAMRVFQLEGRSDPDVDAVRDALSPLARTLAADKFRLDLQSVTGGVASIDVVAEDGACGDCLVPRTVFVAIATDQLAVAHPLARLSVRVGSYPSEH